MEALQRLHNRGSVSTGYDIDYSLKFGDPENAWRTVDTFLKHGFILTPFVFHNICQVFAQQGKDEV